MAVIRIPNDVRIEGDLQANSMSVPSGTISDGQVTANAAIDADKLQHLHKAGTNFASAIGSTASSREEIVFVVSTTASIRAVHALLNDTGTTGTVAFDCKKNSTSVLSTSISFSTSDADRTVKDGTLSITSLAADDILSLSISSTGDAAGPFAWVEVDELAEST